jgi:hypothetical protein
VRPNGYGKSSYARVLRKACRSSAKPVEILPNVLIPGAQPAGTARIEVSLDGSIRAIERNVNAAPEGDLAEVSVFDTDCAEVYACGESEITYTPSSLRLFERLVSFQGQIRKGIEERITQLNATTVPTEGFDSTTRAGALIHALNENVSAATVDALATVSAGDLSRLDELRAQVATAKMVNPTQAAAQFERRANAASELGIALDNLAARVEARVVGELIATNATVAKLTAASSELSAALSRTARLEIGGASWKALWRAAHTYVDSLPSGSIAFPASATAMDAPCPLCQQGLDVDARQRLERFEQYFRGEGEKALERARGDREGRIADAARVPAEARTRAAQVSIIVGGNALLEHGVETFLASVSARAEAISASATAKSIDVPPLTENPGVGLRALAAELTKKAEEQRGLAAPEAITKANREIAEFDNRLLLSRSRDAVLARIEAARQVAKLRAAHSALGTTGLSRRIGELTESAVTEQLRERLLAELQTLGGDHIPVQIGARGIKGKTKVSVALNAAPKVDVGDVLSEGERRAVALAFFLAEVEVAEHGGGIVLDDPVSSLDHTRRSYVARRLVQEAERRQTIVFTHDVVFLLELQDEARRAGRAHQVRVVRRVGSASGVTSQDLPWVAQNVKQRIGFLNKEMQDLGALERKGDPDRYRREAKMWFVLLREAWERAVEEKLFGGVVGRFQPGIETLKLKNVQVSSTMTAAVYHGMTRASAWAHDQAPALGRPPPTGSDLSQALAELETFIAPFK